MDKKTRRIVLDTIAGITGIGKTEFGSDGFFFSQQIDHDLTISEVEQLIDSHPEWVPYKVYEYTLLPLISKNPTKHQSLRSIYYVLAVSCTNDNLKRNYFEKSFRHLILSKLDGVKDVEGVLDFYAVVLTRDSCCNKCKHYNENDIYPFNHILSDLPVLVHDCEHESSCHAAVSVMTSNRYNALLKRRK